MVARVCGARGYVAVERNYSAELEAIMRDEGMWAAAKAWYDRYGLPDVMDIPLSIIDAHMLEFLAGLPDRSVNILTGGIDRCVMDNDDYAGHVERQIARVVLPDGAYVSYKSGLLPPGMVHHQFGSALSIWRHDTGS
jgi:predicted methyltransferase